MATIKTCIEISLAWLPVALNLIQIRTCYVPPINYITATKMPLDVTDHLKLAYLHVIHRYQFIHHVRHVSPYLDFIQDKS